MTSLFIPKKALSTGTPKVIPVNKTKSRLANSDQRKDFKYFIVRAKVCQVYREALLETRLFGDPQMKSEMASLIKDEFRVFRRDTKD